jgi:hypothetical protein
MSQGIWKCAKLTNKTQFTSKGHAWIIPAFEQLA